MGICGGGGGCILPPCDSSFRAVTSSVKLFLQLSQIDINFHGFKDQEADFYLWQQRRFSRLLQKQYRNTDLLKKSRERRSVLSREK